MTVEKTDAQSGNELDVVDDGHVGTGTALIQEKIRPIAAASASVVGGVQKVALVFSLAAGGLILLLIASFDGITTPKILFAVLLAIALSVPAATWWLLGAGLRAVIDLPGQLMEIAGKGTAQVASGMTDVVRNEKGFLSRVVSVLRSLLDLKNTGLEGKLLLVESVAVVRMFNPFTLVLAVGTFVAGMIEIVLLIVIAGLMFVF